jgi:lipopolysaccharide/colanic/teichoic acid biosynthesis glycosyltransferase
MAMAVPIHPTNHREVVAFGEWRQWLDRCLSVIALMVLSPALIVIAACILFESGLPVLFSQSRVGRNGELFRLHKFRTMRHGSTGTSITVAGDRRVTRVGSFLRKFKLDEIPQLWNIVRAEMAFVGPRPEVPEFVSVHEPMWLFVLQVRPGITDPASIAFHQEEKLLACTSDPISYYREALLPAKLAMNIAYMKQRSLWSDFQVVLRTVFCAVFPGKLKTQHATHMIPEDPK